MANKETWSPFVGSKDGRLQVGVMDSASVYYSPICAPSTPSKGSKTGDTPTPSVPDSEIQRLKEELEKTSVPSSSPRKEPKFSSEKLAKIKSQVAKRKEVIKALVSRLKLSGWVR